MTAPISVKHWPPRIVALRSSIREPHDPVDAIVIDPDGYLHPIEDVVYISEQEVTALLEEKEARIRELEDHAAADDLLIDSMTNSLNISTKQLEEARTKLEQESKAASHWMKEACEEHNENVLQLQRISQLEAQLAKCVKTGAALLDTMTGRTVNGFALVEFREALRALSPEQGKCQECNGYGGCPEGGPCQRCGQTGIEPAEGGV